MSKRIIYTVLFFALSLFTAGCCKDKKECVGNKFSIQPFVEKYGSFTCGGNLYEYEYIKRRKSEIDSLTDCTFSPPVAFPIDETSMLYLLVAKLSYFSNDTFNSILYKDTCNKKLIYELSMVQRDSIKVSFFPQGIARSIFCAVENIPADYKIEVKYKYVPLGE